jgi:hypothetical protein
MRNQFQQPSDKLCSETRRLSLTDELSLTRRNRANEIDRFQCVKVQRTKRSEKNRREGNYYVLLTIVFDRLQHQQNNHIKIPDSCVHFRM